MESENDSHKMKMKRQTMVCVCECAAVLCIMQTVKEYANNNGSKNGEINTTSIILNDFAATGMGLCIPLVPLYQTFPLWLAGLVFLPAC